MGVPGKLYRAGRRLLERLVAPLRRDESLEPFTLAIPEAQTTTVDSVQGWQNRPPAVLRCPGCGGELTQSQAIERLDCATCWRDFPSETFAEHDLLALVCPRCDAEMEHGQRHPKMYDVPEWATCPDCRYHWDLDHWY
ncbi:hypothetical protein [Halobacterium yunchengense]|uniref:hypothetical protein n=1 Tax=Halobacterium yunchengense TaxID=3108497 RepID=UPI00300AF13C